MSINNPNSETKRLKREILVRLIKAFYSDDFEENVRLIPYDMRPKNCEVPFRCCVYKERAALKNRTMAGLGVSLENDEERTTLSSYAKDALNREKPDEKALTVLESACQGCSSSGTFVTDLCQGCVARPCVTSCKFGAISVVNGKSVIDPAKCKNCGMCMKACPYQAIQKRIVPCENACPVGAIAKDESGHAKIDFDKCISCGKCVNACPFGAVHEKSQIIDILKAMKSGKKMVAMIAPAIAGQLPCTPQQLHTAIERAGFGFVYEVAQGADITAKHEAVDFTERMDAGAPFMTTSCCAGYNELVDKHIPEMKPYRSDTHTPLYYTAEIVKREHPDCVSVFFSPCVAKRKEAMDNDNVDYVLSFEELGAMFIAKNIDVNNCEEKEFAVQASKEGRNFPLLGGVAKSVLAALGENADLAKPTEINGLTKQSIRDLKTYAKNGHCPLGNLIEVMSCEGGCIGGNATLNSLKTAFKQVDAYSKTSKSLES